MGSTDSKEASYNEEKILCNQDLYQVTPEEIGSVYHRSIGALTYLNSKKQRCAGSGMLISKNLVLTVAHNPYDKTNSLKERDKTLEKLRLYELDKSVFKFYVGGKLGEKYYQIQNWRFLDQFMTCSSNNKLKSDFALIKLKTDVEFDEFLQLEIPCQVCLDAKGQPLQIFGFPLYSDNYYPSDKWGVKLKLKQYGLARQNRIKYFSPSGCKLGYAMSTLGGQSGSPIVADGRIIALHNGGGREQEEFNVGRLITPDLTANLLRWAVELGGHPFKINKNVCSHMQYLLSYKNTFELQRFNNKQENKENIKPLETSSPIKKNNKLVKNIQTYLQIDIRMTLQQSKIVIDDKNLKEIDLTKHLKLREVSLKGNFLKTINLDHNINLVSLGLSKNHIKTIDLRTLHNLSELKMGENELESIELGQNKHLKVLYLYKNRLRQIDLSSNINLTDLSIEHNLLATIDLKRNPKVTMLQVEGNYLQSAFIWYSRQLAHPRLCLQLSEYFLIHFLCSRQEREMCRKWMERKKQSQNVCISEFAIVQHDRLNFDR